MVKICSKIGAPFENHVEVVGERMGKDSAYLLDSTKLRAELDWKDHIALEQGLDQCITWVRDNFDALKSEHCDYIHKP